MTSREQKIIFAHYLVSGVVCLIAAVAFLAWGSPLWAVVFTGFAGLNWLGYHSKIPQAWPHIYRWLMN